MMTILADAIDREAHPSLAALEQVTADLTKLLEDKALFRTQYLTYLPQGRSEPLALLAAEGVLLDSLPTLDDKGKPLSEAARSRLLEQAKRYSADYEETLELCQRALAELINLDTQIDILQVRFKSLAISLTYHTAALSCAATGYKLEEF